MHEDVTTFIDTYRAALGQGPRAIAAFYAEPCVTARLGVPRLNATRRDTERFFTDLDAAYRARGFTHADVFTMDVHPLGSRSALVTVQWAYKGACDELLWKTTFSYNLYRFDGVWKILVQTMHDS